jgi:hypothetical protein
MNKKKIYGMTLFYDLINNIPFDLAHQRKPKENNKQNNKKKSSSYFEYET